MAAPLSKHQKFQLADLSRRAWKQDLELGVTKLTEEEYRHQAVARAVSKAGLRCCDQWDYKAVQAYLLNAIGEGGKALEAQLTAQAEEKRQAEAVLAREVAKSGLSWSYAAAICRRQFKCHLVEATPKQLWNIIFTVRNRARAKRNKTTNQKGQ